MTDVAMSMAQEQIKELRAENERLREEVAILRTTEAADNARLQAAHQEIRELENNKVVSGEGLFMRALLIARRALEPKT